MSTTIVAPIPASQLQRDIHALEQQIANTPQLPNPNVLLGRISSLTTEVLLDPAKKPDLVDARAAYRRYEEQKAELDRLNDELKRLQEALLIRQDEERREAVEQANTRMRSAHAEFYHAAKQLCRAYERCLQVQRANRAIRGAATSIPKDFTIDDFVPSMWQGSTAGHIRDNSLPWMRSE